VNQRIDQLDSLRGLAALTVVASHFSNVFPAKFSGDNYWWNLIRQSPLNGFLAGHESVMLFFVLSGFVLTLPFRKSQVSYAPWITRRICRIYIPYLVAMLSAMLLVVVCKPQPIPEYSSWFNRTFQGPISASIIANHLLLIGSFHNDQLNPVVWSLIIEMRVSLVFPWLVLAVFRWRWWQSLAGAYGLALLGGGLFLFLGRKLGIRSDYPLTLFYLPQFVLGCLLAVHRENLVAAYQSLRREARALLPVLGILLFTYQFWCFPHVRVLHSALTDDLAATLASGLAIVMAIASPTTAAFLSLRPLIWLGRVSYSLYLVHAICLLTTIHLLHGRIPVWGEVGFAGLVTLAVTTVFYHAFERPSIEFGRRLSKGMHREPAANCGTPLPTRV
jgi:peptidoglycan/LPS O-acetylase OafA/YrhL